MKDTSVAPDRWWYSTNLNIKTDLIMFTQGTPKGELPQNEENLL